MEGGSPGQQRVARQRSDDERLARALAESGDALGQLTLDERISLLEAELARRRAADDTQPPLACSPEDAEAIRRVLDADEVEAELSRLRSGPRAPSPPGPTVNDMANWYGAHIAPAATQEDSEALVLELWELLARNNADGPRLGNVATRLLGMPWHQHLLAPLEAHGYDASTRSFPRGPAPGLLQELTKIGAGANPMPFAAPTVQGCQLLEDQRVLSGPGHGVVVFDRVLATADGRGYALVANLQTAIYGRVRKGVELERVPAEAARAHGADGILWRATNVQVAVKCIERAALEQWIANHHGHLNEDPFKEVAVMEYIASQGGAPYVLPLVATYGDDRAVYVILPFCPNGDLFGVVERHGALQEATAATYLGQLVRGLERLHAMGLMHHDISLENTMVDAESRAIIIDFGMAVKAIPTATDFFDGHHAGGSYHAVPLAARQNWPGKCGKPMYMAPELWYPQGSFDAFAADVWALGIMLFMLLTGAPPWEPTWGPEGAAYNHVKDGNLHGLLLAYENGPNPIPRVSENAKDLLQRLLTVDPRQRMTLPELKAHPWWQEHAQFVNAA